MSAQNISESAFINGGCFDADVFAFESSRAKKKKKEKPGTVTRLAQMCLNPDYSQR